MGRERERFRAYMAEQ